MRLVIFDTDRTIREVDATPTGSMVNVVDHGESYSADPDAGVDLVDPPPFGFDWFGMWPPERRTFANLVTGNNAQPLRIAEPNYRDAGLDPKAQGELLGLVHERTGEIADNEAEAKQSGDKSTQSLVMALYIVLGLVSLISLMALLPELKASLGDLY
jgi:hypothetical protein